MNIYCIVYFECSSLKIMLNMQDWKCIIRMLLEDNSSNELDDVDATNLIRLLFASVRKAVGERIVPAIDNRNPHYTKAQKVTLRCSVSLSFCSQFHL